MATLLEEDSDLLPEPTLQNRDNVPVKPNGKAHAVPSNPAPAESTGILGALRSKKTRDQKESRNRNVQTTVPVRTPDKQWYFRAHPDFTMSVGIDILEIHGGADEGLWFLDPRVEFPDELDTYIVPAILTRCITSDNVEFFYLAKQSAKSPKESTRRCIAEAKKNWIKQVWSPTAKGYQFRYANSMRRNPSWTNCSFEELLEKALGDNLISDPNHAVITSLLDPTDDDNGFDAADDAGE
jgi:hypothetical protein